ncbi:hypothetical protein PIB30_070780 [Stylosanthes scabra]|uniref:Uncharacterized protein n=1 Tax=Stylosanthes scabra TaxID=79078 RepID=A0ABU6SQ17_9FABA|nr:hypothetical protein [Stylosanthes scabra]
MKKESLQSKKRSLEANLRKSSTYMRGRGRICVQDDPSMPRLHLTTHRHGKSTHMCGKPLSSRLSSRLDVTSTLQHSPEPMHMRRTTSICVESNEAPSKLLKTHV